jgi:5-methylcytosine-specific restriction enzyme subunit McrC
MSILDEVDDTRLVLSDLDRLRFDRQAERYRNSVDWARWILALLAPSLRAGTNEAPALLFDMNRLFESAVASEARHRLRMATGLSVDAQDRSRFLTALIGAESAEPAFQLRPDLVFRRGHTMLAIADTKWKPIGQDRRGRLRPEEADMYQMHAYATAFACHDLILLYPWRADLAQARAMEYQLPKFNGRAPVVGVACIDVQSDDLPLRIGRWPID